METKSRMRDNISSMIFDANNSSNARKSVSAKESDLLDTVKNTKDIVTLLYIPNEAFYETVTALEYGKMMDDRFIKAMRDGVVNHFANHYGMDSI